MLPLNKLEGEVCLRLDKTRGSDYANLFDMLNAWQAQLEKLESGEITREEYDRWQHYYWETEHQPVTAKDVSQQLSDLLTDGLSDSKYTKGSADFHRKSAEPLLYWYGSGGVKRILQPANQLRSAHPI